MVDVEYAWPSTYEYVDTRESCTDDNSIKCLRWINTIRRVCSISVDPRGRLAHISLHARHLDGGEYRSKI